MCFSPTHASVPAAAGHRDKPTLEGVSRTHVNARRGLVQHPMPHHVDERRVFEAITPGKDVDGVTTASFVAIALTEPGLASCTPAGIMRLLDTYNVDLAGQQAVVVGRSPILGKPRWRAAPRPATRARLITPGPCGVGPMTIAVLLAQTIDAAHARDSAIT